MSRKNNKPAHTPEAQEEVTIQVETGETQEAPSAQDKAENKAIDKAPSLGDRLKAAAAAQAEAKTKGERKPRKASASRGQTFEAWVKEAVESTEEKEASVGTLVHVWLEDHPEAGKGAKGAIEALKTAEEAARNGQVQAAHEARERAKEAARAQAKATASARIYTATKMPEKTGLTLVRKGVIGLAKTG